MDSYMKSKDVQSALRAMLQLTKKGLKEIKSFDVEEIPVSDLNGCNQEIHHDLLSLYKGKEAYRAILKNAENEDKVFVLFKITSESEAKANYTLLNEKLPGYVQAFGHVIFTPEILQALTNTLRSNKTYETAHICAVLGLAEFLATESVKETIDNHDEETGKTPLQVALEAENMNCIEALIKLGSKLDVVDKKGLTVYHYAARCKDPEVLKMLGAKDATLINNTNEEGETALHMACLSKLPENVETLLKFNADPTVSNSHRFPIHCALQAQCVGAVENLCRHSADQVNLKDTATQASNLHWAASIDCITFLCDLKADIEAKDGKGDTPLLKKLKENSFDCVFHLLLRGADVQAKDENNNSCLFNAILLDEPEIIKMLIVFGADINAMNGESSSPRHKASLSRGKNKDLILYYLHTVGARRCEKTKKDCNSGCSSKGNFNGKSQGVVAAGIEKLVEGYKVIMENLAVNAAVKRKNDIGENVKENEVNGTDANVTENEHSSERTGYQVLCLDGGGLNSLSILRMMIEIEAVSGVSIKECFDWIVASGSGTFIALSVIQGKPLQSIFYSLLEIMTKVLKGSKPYNSDVFENLLKNALGSEAKMMDVTNPKILVTGTLIDKSPAKLFFFRNYELPATEQSKIKKQDQKPSEELVWKVARSSGIGPAFFHPYGNFMDGTLLACNPLLEGLTEIHDYEVAQTMTQNDYKKKPIHLITSLGTRHIDKVLDKWDPYVENGLEKMFMEQINGSNERTLNNATVWCASLGIPCFRFEPCWPEINDKVDDARLIVELLWETEVYVLDHSNKFKQLASLLF